MNRFVEFQKSAQVAQREAKAETLGREDGAQAPTATATANLFQPFQKSGAMERGEAVSVSITDEDAEMEMPRFFAQVAEIKKANKLVRQLTVEIEKLHKDSLASADMGVQDECSRQVEVLMGKVNQMTNRTRLALQEIDQVNGELERHAESKSGNLRMRIDNHRQLSSGFVDVMRRYQKMQEVYQEKHRAQLKRQFLIVNPRATAQELEQLTSDPEAMKLQIFAIGMREESRKTLAQMKNRMQDMQKLEQSIVQLRQLFLEMQDLVVSQGDIVNSIQYNYEQIEDYTARAAQDMESAVESQKAIQKKKWILIGIALVVLGIVAISVFFKVVEIAIARAIIK